MTAKNMYSCDACGRRCHIADHNIGYTVVIGRLKGPERTRKGLVESREIIKFPLELPLGNLCLGCVHELRNFVIDSFAELSVQALNRRTQMFNVGFDTRMKELGIIIPTTTEGPL